MFKRLTKKQLAEILKSETKISNSDKKLRRQELKQKIANLKAISRKWDVVGALWQRQVLELEKQFIKI